MRSIWAGRAFVFVAGATLLAGQASWARIATAVVGGTLAAAALTLSAAMAGLGLGALLAGRLRRLLVPVCAATLAVTPWLLLQAAQAEGSPLLRRTLVAAILAAAHFPFGMILPSVAAGRRGGDLYALSALGGLVGALGLAEVLAPRWALDDIGLFLGAATLLSGGLLFIGPATAPEPAPRPSRRTLTLAFLLGVLGLLTETLWLQILGFYWESNTLTFAFVTASSVGGLALGSGLAGRRQGNLPLALGVAAASLAIAAAASPLVLEAFSFGGRWAAASLLIGMPAACFGASFTFLLNRGEGSLGVLLGANTLGSAAGPLLLWAAEPLIAWPARTLLLVACGYGLLAGQRQRLAFVAALGLGGLLLVPAQPPAAAYPGEALMPFAKPGLESTVAVTRDPRSGVDVLWIDRGFQGDTSALGQRIPSVLGEVPGEILGRPPRRSLVIGLGTGLTLAAMARGGAEHIEVAELSQGVIDANRTVLAGVNGHVLEQSGIRVGHEDGRSLLRDATEPFDLIVTDMIFPTVVGAGNLFSREFYALARRRLAEDGVFVHWLPCFLLSPDDLASVTAAFLESFPDATAWIGFSGPQRLILGLAGGATRHPDASIDRLALGPAELRRLAGAAAPIRDADPRLEYRSNRRGDFGRDNLVRLRDGLRTCDLPQAWVERRERWEKSRRGWLLMAEAGLEEEGSDRALELYRESARVSPDPADAEFQIRSLAYERHLALARLAADRGDEDAAIRHLRRAEDVRALLGPERK